MITHWPTLSDIHRYLAPMYTIPTGAWIGLSVVLGIAAAAHAKFRQQREQEQFSEENGWQFSQDSSPIKEIDWQQLSQNIGLEALASAGGRKNFTIGIHAGAQFVLFEIPSINPARPETRIPGNMVAFPKSCQPVRRPD